MVRSKSGPPFELVNFDARFAPTILAWAQDSADALAWASLRETPRDPSIFSAWHRQPGVRPYVLLDGGVPVGYGEVWEESAREIELARIIVAPETRGRGIGRALVDHLLAAAGGPTPPTAFVRVRPGNAAALACYRRAGFSKVPLAAASLYNSGQTVAYVWLSRPELPT